jgi:hypothetical protein
MRADKRNRRCHRASNERPGEAWSTVPLSLMPHLSFLQKSQMRSTAPVSYPARASALSLTLVLALSTRAWTAQPPSITTFSVDDPRPVAAAVQALVSRCRCAISYEDPRYTFAGDLDDVTTQVARDLDKFPRGNAPKVLVPRRHKLTLTVPASNAISSGDVAKTLAELVRSQASSGLDGHFRVKQVGEMLHVVPTEVKDRNGNWSATSSILDVAISLPTQQRSWYSTLQAIAAAIGASAHVRVDVNSGIGAGIQSEKGPKLYEVGANDERARDVLVRALTLFAADRGNMTWLLFYGNALSPIDDLYVLNLLPIPSESSSPASSSEGNSGERRFTP